MLMHKFGWQQVRSEKYSPKIKILFSEPDDMSFADEEDNDFNATLTLTDGTTKSIICKATKVRPAPTFIWTIGNQ